MEAGVKIGTYILNYPYNFNGSESDCLKIPNRSAKPILTINFSNAQDWKHRHAALMAISASGEGCHKQMEPHLPTQEASPHLPEDKKSRKKRHVELARLQVGQPFLHFQLV